jgi:branched-chain amino acid transport system permease protein
MDRRPRPPFILLAAALAGAAATAAARATLDDYGLSIVNFVGIYAILAVSLNLTNGFAGLFSLGHPGFMAIGGCVTAVLTFPVERKAMFLALPGWLAGLEVGFLPALLLGGAAAALTACLVGLPVLRLRGHYLAVATMGFLIIVQVLIENWESVTRGPLGLNGLAALTDLGWVYGWLVAAVAVSWKVKFSSFGRSLLAMREDSLAAQCLGVDLFRSRVAALAIGAFFAGVAGGLWAHLVTAITPGTFSLVLAFNIVVMVVVGGTGSITGSLLAAVVFSALTELFRPLEERLEMYGIAEILMALLLLLILVLRPSGLFGSREPGFLSAGPISKPGAHPATAKGGRT